MFHGNDAQLFDVPIANSWSANALILQMQVHGLVSQIVYILGS